MSSNTKALIVIVDDDEAMRESLSDYFHRTNYATQTYSSGKELLLNLDNHPIEAIICDLKMPQMDGMDVLRELKNREKTPPLIMVTAHGNIPTAVEAIKNGAYNFIAKPFNPKDLQQMVEQAISKHQLESTAEELSKQPLGKSQTIQAFHTHMLDCAKTTSNILLTGEKGVEKPLVAKTLHQYSRRNTQPFIRVNCHLISERFFEKTFLEADSVFSKAETGTLFLENLDKLPLENRSKLLSLLERKINTTIHQSNSSLPPHNQYYTPTPHSL